MKQTSSKLRTHVVHVYFEYVSFIFASSCKRGITTLVDYTQISQFITCTCISVISQSINYVLAKIKPKIQK